MSRTDWWFPDWCSPEWYPTIKGRSRIRRTQQLAALWLAGSFCTDRGPPRVWLSGKPVLFHSSYLKALPGGQTTYTALTSTQRSCSFASLCFPYLEPPMAGHTGPRSCTWTEFPVDILTNSSLISRSTVGSNCDLTLLTCLLIGSYRFGIIPLLAVFNSKDGNRLCRSEHRWSLSMNAWRGATLCFPYLDLFINLMPPYSPYCLKNLWNPFL